MTDYDSPWKEALELYFPAFLALFRPRIHADIDWSRGHNFLDKELQRILPKADRYNRTVVSLAVLADHDPDWRPDHYQEELWDWSVPMGWLPVKLLDYADRVAEWERSQNLFAPVVLVHLKALETRHDPEGRRTWKFQLVRSLYKRGFSKEEVRQLLRVIDWLMELPPRLQKQFEQDLHEFEEGQTMPYFTGIERSGMRKLIEDLLRSKFGDECLDLMPAILELDDAEKYSALDQFISSATTLDEVRQAVADAAAPPSRRKKGGNRKRGLSEI